MSGQKQNLTTEKRINKLKSTNHNLESIKCNENEINHLQEKRNCLICLLREENYELVKIVEKVKEAKKYMSCTCCRPKFPDELIGPECPICSLLKALVELEKK